MKIKTLKYSITVSDPKILLQLFSNDPFIEHKISTKPETKPLLKFKAKGICSLSMR